MNYAAAIVFKKTESGLGKGMSGVCEGCRGNEDAVAGYSTFKCKDPIWVQSVSQLLHFWSRSLVRTQGMQ